MSSTEPCVAAVKLGLNFTNTIEPPRAHLYIPAISEQFVVVAVNGKIESVLCSYNFLYFSVDGCDELLVAAEVRMRDAEHLKQ